MCININGAMMTDLVYWDMPYGMALADWDVLLSDMDVEILFQQLAVVNRARAHCLVLGCIWHDMGRIRAAMHTNGYTDMHVIVVYKPQQNTSGMEWINAEELLVAGYKGGVKACKLTFSDINPVFRHNVFFSHQVGPKLRHAGQEAVVNATQKNPNVASAIGRIMCATGSRALVLGAGSGSEVLGLARIGVNVVGVERDGKQFLAVTQRITAEAASPDEVLKKLADDEQNISLLSQLSAKFTKLLPDAQAHFMDSDEAGKQEDANEGALVAASSESEQRKPECPVCGQAVSASDREACAKTLCPSKTLHRACVTTCGTCGKMFCSVDCSGDHGCS